MASSRILKLFAYIQMTKKEIIRQGELQEVFNISLKQEQNFLSRLTKKSTIIRLLPGIYLVPQKIPPGGKWQPDALYVISQFMKVVNANYYVSGLYAFNYYGLSEQIPNKLTVYNDKISAAKKFGLLDVKFIKIPTIRIGNPERIELTQTSYANISSLSRTIIDALRDWKRFGTMPTALEWIDQYLSDIDILKQIVRDTIKFGNISSQRRIGYYLFKKTSNKKLVEPILNKLKPTQNWVPLNPVGPSNGITNKTWRIIDNVSAKNR